MKKTRTLAKVILLSLFLTLFTLNSYAQKVTLSFQNETFEKVLNSIKQQTGLSLVFSEQLVDLNRKISINVNSVEVEDALKQLMIETNLSYEIKNNKLYLIEKKNIESKKVPNLSKKINGLVTDEKGDPIIGASIVLVGSKKGTITDINGNFSIEAEEQSTVFVSYIGYMQAIVKVGTQNNLKIVLVENNKTLDEIVVVGYGTGKRVNLTGSVATISNKELTLSPIASTTNALAGRLPGLIVKQESGLPGGDEASLSIRGFGAPLIIVDGVESSFNNIDANEIESISVLKDAAAAIYGARAGDGVILVTTKRGTSQKPTITLTSNISYQGSTNIPKMASSGQYAEMIRGQQINSGDLNVRFTEEEVALYYAGTNPDYPNTDWLKLVANDWAPQQQHNLSVRGGSDKIKYYGFLGFLDQQTMFKNNGGGYQRYNLRSNIDAKIIDNLSAQIDVSSIWETKNYARRGYVGDNSVWNEYWNTLSIYSATLPDPTKIAYGGSGGSISLPYMTNIDLSGYDRTQSQNFKASLALIYTFKQLKGLTAKAFVNTNQNNIFNKLFYWGSADSYTYNYSNQTYTQQTTQSPPQLTQRDTRSSVLTGQFSLNYNGAFGKNHNVSALALYEVIDYYTNWFSAYREGFKTKSIDYLFAGGFANQVADGRATEMGRQSFICRMNYAYKSRYLMEATVRTDESAKFSEASRRGIFPSASLAWRISEERLIKKKLSKLENLKLRLSYSQTGKDAVGNFQYLTGYQYGRSYLIGTTAASGLEAMGMENPFLTWEKMTIYNAGLDFSIAKRAFWGELDVFYRDRTGIPGQKTVSISSTFGADLPLENLNSINTRGFELQLGHEGKYRDLKWSVKGNISWSRSKWGFYDEPVYIDPDQKRQQQQTGQWTDRVFGFKSEGLFTNADEIAALTYVYDETLGNKNIKPGDIKYQDVNQDGLLDWKDKVEIGAGNMPHWMGGFNVDLVYKNFDITTFFQGAFGFTQYVNLRFGNNYSELMYNERWTPENNQADRFIPRLGGAPSNIWVSDFYSIKADYIRLKSMSLGYNLPKSFLKKLNIQTMRFSVSGTNLFTISDLNKYSIDPETPNAQGGRWYPQSRTISFGLNASL